MTEENRFGVAEVLEGIPNLGLLIDLTNTDKYYNSKEFRDRGIEHVKIYTEGQVVPSNTCYMKLSKAINRFLEKNVSNDRLIGIHCTHGINRTGYLICAYLIKNNKWTVTDAINHFEKARNHKIERRAYIDALCNLENPTTCPVENMQTYGDYRRNIKRAGERIGNGRTKLQKVSNYIPISSNYQRLEDRHIAVEENYWRNRNEYSSNYQRRAERRTYDGEDNWRNRNEYSSNYQRRPERPTYFHEFNWRKKSDQNTDNPYSWRRKD